MEGRLRRYYRITDEGRDKVVQEAERLAAAAGVVRRMAPLKPAEGLA